MESSSSLEESLARSVLVYKSEPENRLKHCPLIVCIIKLFPCSSTALTHASLRAFTHAEAKHVENAPEGNLDDF